jgi:outer membrane protein
MLKKMFFLAALMMASQAVQAEIKIGVVNVPLLMANAPQAADAKKRLEKEFSPSE